MNGILLVDKPAGWTSHDVVAKVRSTLRIASRHEPRDTSQKHATRDWRLATKIKVGHTGTLDPMATGLLVLVIGDYTKRAAEFSKLDKTYEAEITLGATSTTADAEGKITPVNSRQPALEEVREVIASFVGEIEQTPPAYSAIKIGGQRAYMLARSGKNLVIEPRKVTIYQIKDLRYRYPLLSFTAKVSSGTYIRSLAEDIGKKLGTGAYLSALRRTRVGDFSLENARAIDSFKPVANR